MPRTSPAEKRARIIKVTLAWQRFARDTKFYSTTLAEFKEEVKPSLDVREEIRALQLRLRAALSLRRLADARSMKLIRQVGYGVAGDRNHGNNSALYEAMGYTRNSKRIQNIRKARRRQR